LLLSACTVYDPTYLQLEPAVETNPRSNDIVGMWHRKGGDGMGRHETYSVLFAPSGEGHFDSLITDLLIHEDASGKFTWAYQGAGVWTTALKAGDKPKGIGYYFHKPTQWRLSGSSLLQHTTWPGSGELFYVWERVRQ
jgi:hypothetical protein